MVLAFWGLIKTKIELDDYDREEGRGAGAGIERKQKLGPSVELFALFSLSEISMQGLF